MPQELETPTPSEPVIELPAPEPIIQPTAPAPRIDAVTLLQQTLDFERQRSERLEAENNRLKATPPEPELTPEQARAKYFDDPMSAIEAQIRKTVAPMLQPIAEYTSSIRQKSEYDTIKDQLRTKFGKEKFDSLEKHVDQFVTQGKVPPTLQNIQAIYYTALGAASAGDLPGYVAPSTPTPVIQPPVNPTPPVVTPPHLRPSSPTPPTPSDDKPKRRSLNEAERHVARFNKLTDDEYLDGIEAGAQVESWTKKVK